MTSPITSTLGPAEQEITGTALQSTLVDLIDLSLVAKQAHWNVVGRQFRDMHLALDELVTTARGYTDTIAERSAAIGVSPDGRAATVSHDSGVPAFGPGWVKDTEVVPAVVATLAALVARLRERIEATDKSDTVTQDLLIELTAKLEQAHWMWQAQNS